MLGQGERPAAVPLRRELETQLGVGLGIAVGAGITLIGHTLWTILAGPAQEWLTGRVLRRWGERDETPRVPRALDALPRIEGRYRVLLSDLHIDTWVQPTAATATHPRAAAFGRLLGALRARATDPAEPQGVDVYINGDLLDIPLHPAHEGAREPSVLHLDDDFTQPWEGVLRRVRPNGPAEERLATDTLLGALRNVVHDGPQAVRLFYLTGNHDIGISGLRYFRPNARRQPLDPQGPPEEVLDLPAHAIWNPAMVLQTGERWVYIEHGHLHDPLLWLYLRYALVDLLRGRARRGEHRLVRQVQRQRVGQDSSAGTRLNLRRDHTHLSRGLANTIVRLRFRQAARRTFRRLYRTEQGRKIKTVVFGHTHLPERYELKVWWFERGRLKWDTCTYINAGSWAGNTEDQLVWFIHPDGRVDGPVQWAG